MNGLSAAIRHIQLYDFLNVFAFFVLLAFNLRMLRKKLELFSRPLDRFAPAPAGKGAARAAAEKKRRRLAALEIFLLSCVQFFSGVVLNGILGDLLTDGADNYFGFAVFAPLVFLLVCRLARTDPFGHLDLFTPAYAAALVIFKLACFTAACCGGIHTNMTFWYPHGPRSNFPVQLVEMLVALGIFFFLLRYRKRAKPGTMHPVYLMLYSGTRFFTEFLRIEPDIFLCFKLYHILCAAGFLIGAGEYLLMTAGNGRFPERTRLRVTEGRRKDGEAGR